MDDKIEKILTNVEKMVTASGFIITAQGDESVGISSSTWTLQNDFIFDNQEELEDFKIQLKVFFELNYCGEPVNVIEEYKGLESIEYKGYIYWYEYKLAKHRVDMCLATNDPKKYCNGFYLYSSKDPGNGKAFVIVKTNNPNPLNND